MKSAGVSEYFVNIILHACKKNKRACVFKHNGTKEHTKQMDIINMILARPNILVKDPVHEFKFDNLVGNAESPSDVILVQVISSIVLLQYYMAGRGTVLHSCNYLSK